MTAYSILESNSFQTQRLADIVSLNKDLKFREYTLWGKHHIIIDQSSSFYKPVWVLMI